MKYFNTIVKAMLVLSHLFYMQAFAVGHVSYSHGKNRVPNNLLSKDEILRDSENKISEDFHIPQELLKRTSFWYDVYTIYNSNQHVIHHKDYPWIVFHVVDVAPLLNSGVDYKNKWTKFHKAEKFAKSERVRIKKTLLALSKRKSYDNLEGLDLELFEAVKEIPGPRSKVLRKAAYSMRTQIGQRDYIEKGIVYSSQYLPIMENIFKDRDLPVELTRLPFVESSFNIEALSKAGASGIWQFMPNTGSQLMKVGERVDERNNPIKATYGAAKLLAQYNKILKSWPLAITAYNHGVGSMQNTIKKYHTSNIVKIIKHSDSFGFASSNYYPSFLAVLYAQSYQKNIFGDLQQQSPLSFKEVKITSAMNLKKLLRAAQIDIEKFKDLNQDIDEDSFKLNPLLPRGFVVHLPEANEQKLLGYLKQKRPFKKGSKISAAEPIPAML